MVSIATLLRRNIFGPHSPLCRDEISPEKSVDTAHAPRPASRTQSRVLSNEDAIKAINAVVMPSTMDTKAKMNEGFSPGPVDRSKQSTPSLSGEIKM